MPIGPSESLDFEGLFFGGKIRVMRLNLALAQIATKLGDVESNLEKHLDYIKQAKSQKMDLLVFPELSLTGYVLQDLVATVAHRPVEDDPVFKHLLKASRDLDLADPPQRMDTAAASRRRNSQ